MMILWRRQVVAVDGLDSIAEQAARTHVPIGVALMGRGRSASIGIVAILA